MISSRLCRSKRISMRKLGLLRELSKEVQARISRREKECQHQLRREEQLRKKKLLRPEKVLQPKR